MRVKALNDRLLRLKTILLASAALAWNANMPASAADVLTNGNFETGDFTGWLVAVNAGSGCDTRWNVAAHGGATNCAPVANPTGTFAAYTAMNAFGGSAALSQTFNVNAGVQSAVLNWSHTATWTMIFPRTFSVDLYDDNDVLISNLYTETFDPSVFGQYGWTPHAFDLTSILQGLAGSTLRLAFSITLNTQGTNGLGLDEVSLDIVYGLCNVGAGNDVCLVTSASGLPYPLTDADGGDDTLQLGGAANFAFDVSQIGSTFANFEDFQKVDASNVTLTGTATGNVEWQIVGGTLTASGGNAIGDTASVMMSPGTTLALTQSEAIGSVEGAGSLDLAANTLTVGANHRSTTFIGAGSGTGGLTKTGVGWFTLVGAQNYSGDTTVSQGRLILNGSLAGDLLIAPGAGFGGNATIFGDVVNQGTIASGNSTGSTIIGGNYAGGGSLDVEVFLNQAGSPVNGVSHDFLSIGGNVTGTTLINIITFGAAAPTTGNGMELVRIAGTASDTSFALAHPVTEDGYQYFLRYLPNYSGTTNGVFLQSTARDEVWNHAALLAATKAMNTACLRHEERDNRAANRSKSRVWVGYANGAQETDSDTGIETDQDFSCGVGGVDIPVSSQLRAGLSAAYGNASVDIATPVGVHALDGDQKAMEAYLLFERDVLFAGFSAGYATTDWTAPANATATASGVVAQARVGATLPVGQMNVALAGELNYDGTSCSGACLLPGVREDRSELAARATLRIDGTFSNGNVLPFVTLSLSDDLGDGDRVVSESALIATDTRSRVYGAQAGLSVTVVDSISLYGAGGMTESDETGVSGFDAHLGVKASW